MGAHVPRRAARRRRDPWPRTPARGRRRRPRPSSCGESRTARGGWWWRRRGPLGGEGTLLPSWQGREGKGSLGEVETGPFGFRVAGLSSDSDPMRWGREHAAANVFILLEIILGWIFGYLRPRRMWPALLAEQLA